MNDKKPSLTTQSDSERLNVRLPARIAAMIREMAEEDGISVNSEIVMLLSRAARAHRSNKESN